MQYEGIKTLKAQVEYILATHVEARNSDAELTRLVCGTFWLDAEKQISYDPVRIATSVERCRRKFNEELKYLPTIEEVARRRKMNIEEWRVAMGYQTTNGTYTPPSVVEARQIDRYASKTKRGVWYEVKEVNGIRECTCPSFAYRKECVHVQLSFKKTQLERQGVLFALPKVAYEGLLH